MKAQQRGFTLWELLMTLLVAGILIGIGIPNVMEFQRNSAMTGAANDLITAVLTARTEAVKRQSPVTLCLTEDPDAATPVCELAGVSDADLGFVVWVDENGNRDANGVRILTDGTDGNAVIDADEPILLRGAAPGGAIQVSSDCPYTTYNADGFTRRVGALCFPATRAVLYCDDRGRRVSAGTLSSARVVNIDRPGRGQVLQEVDVINAVIDGPLSGVAPTCP